MGSPTERKMSIVRTSDIQTVRIRKSLWVAVASRHHCDYRLTLSYAPSAKNCVFRGQTCRMLAGAFVTQQFFNSCRNHGQIAAELFELVGVAQQGKDAVADEVCGGLLTSHHGYNAVRYHLFLGQTVALNFRLH